jgi:hypothetical protein
MTQSGWTDEDGNWHSFMKAPRPEPFRNSRNGCEHMESDIPFQCPICWPLDALMDENPVPFRANSTVLAEFFTHDEFCEFIAYRPAPHLLRPDFDIGEPGIPTAFFNVGEMTYREKDIAMSIRNLDADKLEEHGVFGMWDPAGFFVGYDYKDQRWIDTRPGGRDR